MKLGAYKIGAVVGKLPQKVASGFSRVFDRMVGTEYTPIAYLGSKVVNGINHAVLAEQSLVTGKDVHSIALVVLNEKPGDVDGSSITIVSIDPILSDAGLLGGYRLSDDFKITPEAQQVFDKAFTGFVGSNIKPFALLATKIVHGVEYVFAAEMTMLVSPSGGFDASGSKKSIALISVYSDYTGINIEPIVEGTAVGADNSDDKDKGELVGYAFTWLTSARKNWP